MSSLQFPPSEFDEWADSYDEDTATSTGFPFDGYSHVLDLIVEKSGITPGDAVLDLGTGTGNLAVRLAKQGARLWCLDFSSAMLAKAKAKLPEAVFAQADLRSVLPGDFQRRYNAIVSAYTFHHFPLEEKVAIIRRLLEENLLPDGRLVIGDITFPDAAAQEEIRRRLGDEWEQEFFWLADESLAAFADEGWTTGYQQISFCAGVFWIQPDHNSAITEQL